MIKKIDYQEFGILNLTLTKRELKQDYLTKQKMTLSLFREPLLLPKKELSVIKRKRDF